MPEKTTHSRLCYQSSRSTLAYVFLKSWLLVNKRPWFRSRPRRFRYALDSTSSPGRFSGAPWGRDCARFQASSAVQSDSGNEIAWGRGCKCLAEPHISNINSTKGPICRTSSIFPNFIAATHLCEQNALHCTFLGVKNSFQFKCNGNSLL